MHARISLIAAALAASVAFAAPPFVAPAYAEMTKMVGGAPMYPSKNIIENAVHSKDHTTLVAAGEGRRPRRHAAGRRAVHRLRADQRRFRSFAGRNGRDAAQAGEQGQADVH